MKLGLLKRSTRLSRDFPGYQAGASLKQLVRDLLDGFEPSYFPGYQAGASLKRLPVRQALRSSRTLPRLPSRGLIEAKLASYYIY